MKKRATLDDLRASYRRIDIQDERALHEVLSPDETGAYLVRSIFAEGCLIHRVRFVVDRMATWYRDDLMVHRSYHTECGNFFQADRAEVIQPADATFGCHLCLANCERHGIDTFGLIPDTGCASSGGRAWRPARAKEMRS